jgi:hypothetical protein
LGVPARRLAVALSATSPRADYRAVGFPLQSLTRKYVVLPSLFLSIVATCQTQPAVRSSVSKEFIEQLTPVDSSFLGKYIPLTYFPTGSSSIDSIVVTGIIREQSSMQVFCGVLCLSGTMRVEVTKVERGNFTGTHLFAVLPCFVHRDEDLGRTIRIVVTPLPSDRDIGCYSNVWNTIDSHGVPFYFSEEDHIDRE